MQEQMRYYYILTKKPKRPIWREADAKYWR